MSQKDKQETSPFPTTSIVSTGYNGGHAIGTKFVEAIAHADNPLQGEAIQMVIDQFPSLLDSSVEDITGTQAVEMMVEAVQGMLVAIGEDPSRDGLRETPIRVAKSWLQELFSGYGEDPAEVLKTFESEQYDQMVVVKDIPLISTCEHHVLPFVGVCHVGYIPTGRVVGLSKIPRLVNVFARRLQIQERLTAQIADAMQEYLDPKGVMVVAEAEHMCMTIRGVQTPGTRTITSAVRGVFLDDAKRSKEEFLRIISR